MGNAARGEFCPHEGVDPLWGIRDGRHSRLSLALKMPSRHRL
ncbi:MAG: hypothetical protein ACJAQT_000018 [Akkermansiaceae bacterium]|jgi:hypothetical protein